MLEFPLVLEVRGGNGGMDAAVRSSPQVVRGRVGFGKK